MPPDNRGIEFKDCHNPIKGGIGESELFRLFPTYSPSVNLVTYTSNRAPSKAETHVATAKMNRPAKNRMVKKSKLSDSQNWKMEIANKNDLSFAVALITVYKAASKISSGPVALTWKEGGLPIFDLLRQPFNLLISSGCAANRPQRMPQMHCANSVSMVPIFSSVYAPIRPPNAIAGTKLAKNIKTTLKN